MEIFVYKLKSMKKLIFIISILISQGKIGAKPESPTKWNIASMARGAAALSVGAITYGTTNWLSGKFIGPKDNLDPVKKYSLIGALSSISALSAYLFNRFLGAYIQDSSYIALTKKSMISETTNICLDYCHRHILYLKVLNSFKLEFTKLVESLDTNKYHESGLPERLEILDQAFYCLIENNFITTLEKELNAYKAKLQLLLPRVAKYIEAGSKDHAYLEEIKSMFAALNSVNESWDTQSMLSFLQENRMQSLSNPFSCLYTHIKLFNKGFNEGINIVDEADKVNSLGFDILDRITFQLYKLTEKIEENLKEFSRRSGLEKLIIK